MPAERELAPAVQPRIRELDGWRAVSVLLVIAGHLVDFRYYEFFRDFPGLQAVAGIWSRLGVHTFFCISGFVITRLLVSEEATQGCISPGRFYIRRVFKILPPLVVYLLAVAALSAAGIISVNRLALLKSGMFLCNIQNGPNCEFFVDHTWTLAIEEQFYLVFPAILILLKPAWRSRLFILLTVLFLSCSLAKSLWHLGTPVDNGGSFASIAVGVAAALTRDPLIRFFAGFRYPSAAIVVILVILSQVPHTIDTVLLYKTCCPLLIALMLILSVSRESLVGAFLRCRPMQLVGAMSYSLYLSQQLFLARGFLYLHRPTPLEMPIALVVVAPLLYWFIERPCTRLGRTFAVRQKNSGASTD
jgi:peptidoglycan/LPS O-acetylase OafA/YrhL